MVFFARSDGFITSHWNHYDTLHHHQPISILLHVGCKMCLQRCAEERVFEFDQSDCEKIKTLDTGQRVVRKTTHTPGNLSLQRVKQQIFSMHAIVPSFAKLNLTLVHPRMDGNTHRQHDSISSLQQRAKNSKGSGHRPKQFLLFQKFPRGGVTVMIFFHHLTILTVVHF